MNKTRIGVAVAVFLAASSLGASTTSRLESDFDQQSPLMRVVFVTYQGQEFFRGGDDGTHWRGEFSRFYLVGKDIRAIEWVHDTGHHRLYRTILFAKGQPELVIETRQRRLKSGATPEDYERKYWLHDRSAGPGGMKSRRLLLDHAQSLVGEFNANQKVFAGTPRNIKDRNPVEWEPEFTIKASHLRDTSNGLGIKAN